MPRNCISVYEEKHAFLIFIASATQCMIMEFCK